MFIVLKAASGNSTLERFSQNRLLPIFRTNTFRRSGFLSFESKQKDFIFIKWKNKRIVEHLRNDICFTSLLLFWFIRFPAVELFCDICCQNSWDRKKSKQLPQFFCTGNSFFSSASIFFSQTMSHWPQRAGSFIVDPSIPASYSF